MERLANMTFGRLVKITRGSFSLLSFPFFSFFIIGTFFFIVVFFLIYLFVVFKKKTTNKTKMKNNCTYVGLSRAFPLFHSLNFIRYTKC